MTSFHGGYLVRALDPAVAEPIRVALADGLRRLRADPAQHRLTFAIWDECPVMRVAIHGPVADGKDHAFFHCDQAWLGAEVARATRADVWVYHFENRGYTESVHRFRPDGTDDDTYPE